MRWPRRRKGTVTVDERGLTALNADTPLRDLAAACYDAGIDLEITASPERAKPDNPQVSGNYSEIPNSSIGQEDTMPEHTTAARDAMQRAEDKHLSDAVRDVRDAKPPFTFTTQIDGVKIARCDSTGLTYDERAQYQRGLREGRLDNTVVRAEVVGSSEWLRDLADRLQQYGELIDMADPEVFTTTPRAIRSYADKTERQAAADTRDRERVEPILAARWAKDRDRQFLPSLVPTWDDLTDEERAHCIDYGLELYRAGRDDTVAAWQPGNGGGSGNPGTRGGQPAGQGGAHHA